MEIFRHNKKALYISFTGKVLSIVDLNYGRRPIPPSRVSVSPFIYLKSGEAS